MNKKLIIFSTLLCAIFQLNGTPLTDLSSSLKLLSDTMPPKSLPTLESMSNLFQNFLEKATTEKPPIPPNMPEEEKKRATEIITKLEIVKQLDLPSFLEKTKAPPETKRSSSESRKLLNEVKDKKDAIQNNKMGLPKEAKKTIDAWDDDLLKLEKTLKQEIDASRFQDTLKALTTIKTWADTKYSIEKSTPCGIDKLYSATIKIGKDSPAASPLLTELATKITNTLKSTTMESMLNQWPDAYVAKILDNPSNTSNANPFYRLVDDIKIDLGSPAAFRTAVKNNFPDRTKLKNRENSIQSWKYIRDKIKSTIDKFSSNTPAQMAYNKIYNLLIDYIRTLEGKKSIENELKDNKDLKTEDKTKLQKLLTNLESVFEKTEVSCGKKTRELLKELFSNKNQEVEDPETCINNIRTSIDNAALDDTLKNTLKDEIKKKENLFSKALSGDEKKYHEAIVALARYATLVSEKSPTDATLLNKPELLKARTKIESLRTSTAWVTPLDKKKELASLKKVYKALDESVRKEITEEICEQRKTSFKSTISEAVIKTGGYPKMSQIEEEEEEDEDEDDFDLDEDED